MKHTKEIAHSPDYKVKEGSENDIEKTYLQYQLINFLKKKS